MVINFAIGKDLLERTKSSMVASSAAESDAFESIMGFKSSILFSKFA